MANGLISSRQRPVRPQFAQQEVGPPQPYPSSQDVVQEWGDLLYRYAGEASPLFRPIPHNWRDTPVTPEALEELAAMVAGSSTPLAMPLMALPKNALLPDRAKKFFGTTYNKNASGYVMHDGQMLDMSGYHYGEPGSRSTRNVDHRELAGQSRYLNWGEEELASEGGTKGMFEFMDQSGAIRWMPEANSASMTGVPTRQQAERLIKNFNEAKRNGEATDLMLDFDNPSNMDTIESLQLERPTVDGIIKEAERIYAVVGQKASLPEGKFTVDDFDWDKVSDWMKKNGYDSRGADDAQERIGKRLGTSTLSDDHRKALEYGRKK